MEAPARKATGLCSKLCKSGPQLYRNFILRHKNKSSFCTEREMRGAGNSLFAGMLTLVNIPHGGMQMPRNSESSCCYYLGPPSQVLQGSTGREGNWSTAEEPAPPAYGTWQGRIMETWVSSQEDTAALKCPSRTRKKEWPFPCSVHSLHPGCETSGCLSGRGPRGQVLGMHSAPPHLATLGLCWSFCMFSSHSLI